MQRTCRFCEKILEHPFLDLGMSPLSNAFLRAEQLEAMEPFYALRAYFCNNCFLAQLPEFQSPENIFHDYAYFSSYSQSWLDHAKKYAQDVTARFGLDAQSQVIEVASNDGYRGAIGRIRMIGIVSLLCRFPSLRFFHEV